MTKVNISTILVGFNWIFWNVLSFFKYCLLNAGCSTFLIPDQVAQALNLNLESMNTQPRPQIPDYGNIHHDLCGFPGSRVFLENLVVIVTTFNFCICLLFDICIFVNGGCWDESWNRPYSWQSIFIRARLAHLVSNVCRCCFDVSKQSPDFRAEPQQKSEGPTSSESRTEASPGVDLLTQINTVSPIGFLYSGFCFYYIVKMEVHVVLEERN